MNVTNLRLSVRRRMSTFLRITEATQASALYRTAGATTALPAAQPIPSQREGGSPMASGRGVA